MHNTVVWLERTDFPSIDRVSLDTLQVNLGYRCNQSCVHCHVDASPKRTEMMSADNIALVLEVLDRLTIRCLDVTGGAPEMNPHFRTLVKGARRLGVEVIDRCNLTILSEPGYEDLATFLAEQGVVVCASLPCYLEDNVDRQRGKGVFDASIRGLQMLNALGYGDTERGDRLSLDLVFNPQGPVLPPPQAALTEDYKRMLGERYGIRFHRLFTITNMPIARFGSTLVSKGQFHPYMTLLKNHYNADNLSTVMCRSLLSVDWQGFLYDCDFNQMLKWPLQGQSVHLNDLLQGDTLNGSRASDPMSVLAQIRSIRVGDHCYACTAGQGSSCSGALAEV